MRDLDRTTSHVLEGRELIDYLVEKTSSSANAELLHREDRRNRRMTILMTMVGAVGVGGIIGALKLFVGEEMKHVETRMETVSANIQSYVDNKAAHFKEDLDIQIAAAVSAQVEEQVGQVRTELHQYKIYQELIEQSQTITTELSAGKVPYQALNSAITYIEELATADSITSHARFLDAVNVVIDLLVRSDRNSDIDRLEAALREKLASHKNIALNLTDHYGQVIISSPYPVEKLPQEFEALSRYARASREMKYPEKALMWELFVAYKGSQYQRTPTTDVMIETVQDLSNADLGNFCYHIFKNSHPLHWEHRPDQEGRELARLVNKMLEDYPDLLKTVETQIAKPNIRPSIEEMVAKKVARMEKLQAEQSDEVPQTATAPENENFLRR